jgi:2-keto-4-pentenoate hydratase/2-oxohepta-3-ene-1,7-dioic acid hydratase in catechol pathway
VKIVLFETPNAAAQYGLLTSQGVVPFDDLLDGDTPQERLQHLIDSFDTLRPRLTELAATASPVPLDSVRLLPPIPWPGKILITTANYTNDPSQPLLATLKSPESVIGADDTVRLPDVDSSWQFLPQAMLGLVIRGPAKNVSANNWHTAVFGYTCVIDVMARGDQQFGRDLWLAKSDTLGPLGPCIVTTDELADPTSLRVRSRHNGSPAQDFLIAQASQSIPDQLQFTTTVMSLHSGDILACGTSPVGLRPLTDGDNVEVEIEPIGRLSVKVAAPVRSTA